MALRSHEYVECQEERKRPLILSEVVDFVLTLTSQDRLPFWEQTTGTYS